MTPRIGWALAIGVALAATACNSSTKVTAPTTVPAPTSSTSTSSTGSTGSTASGATTSIGSESSSYGSILAANGKTLYMLSIDTPTKSNCTSSDCKLIWPPLDSVPSFGQGVNKALFGHLSGAGGAQQVTYGGHPLYFYTGDSSPGQTNGEGITSYGGTWYVLSASTGKPVTASTSSTSNSSTTTSSGAPSY